MKQLRLTTTTARFRTVHAAAHFNAADAAQLAAASRLPPNRLPHKVGMAVAVALHAGVFLAWWLTPPLRLKVEPGPERWAQVSSLPRQPLPAPVAVPAPPTASKAGKPVKALPGGRIVSAPPKSDKTLVLTEHLTRR